VAAKLLDLCVTEGAAIDFGIENDEIMAQRLIQILGDEKGNAHRSESVRDGKHDGAGVRTINRDLHGERLGKFNGGISHRVRQGMDRNIRSVEAGCRVLAAAGLRERDDE